MSAGNQPESERGGLITLLFTDVVGSTALKQRLGDKAGVALLQEHHAQLRQLLAKFPGAEEISTAGDCFFLVFPKPSDGVRFALLLQSRLREFNGEGSEPIQDRIGLHLGEVLMREHRGQRDLHGMQVDTCARVMSLGQAGQILMTRPLFDNARQSLKGEEIEGISGLEWLNHGRFELKGVDEPVEICEVRSSGAASLSPPTTSEKARRVESGEGEAVLGWRPAVGQLVPNTQWVLQEKLGEGGFGEVWLGRHQVMKERRVFKFCFRADRVRYLKREMTLFRVIKERIGDHPNIVALREVYFEKPPYYVEEEYVAGQDLASWCATQGGADKVPLEARLEIIAQIADALQAAHDAGVIHRDVKPANILVSSRVSGSQPSTINSQLLVKLTDFGIGQVISEEALAGMTRAGFTQTMLGPQSSSHSGTQLYMAPELFAGKPASTRSDIYSLGVVLYQLLIADLRQAVTIDWVKRIADPLLADDLERCLVGEPTERWSSAKQLANNLRAWEQRRADAARRQAEAADQQRLRQQAEHRRKLVLASVGVASLLLLLGAALGYGFWRTRLARDLAQAHAYAADMNLAQQALTADDLGKANRLLDRYRPGSGREHLRGFEWRCLAAEARSDYAVADTSCPKAILRLALSPDGRTVAVGRWFGDIELWDALSLKRMATLETNVGFAAGVTFAPKSGILAASVPGGGIRFWELNPLRVLSTLAHTNAANRLVFSPDERHLASLGIGLFVWDLDRRPPVMCYQDLKFRGDGYGGGAICFSPDGASLVTGDMSGDIHVRDWRANQILVHIRSAHGQPVTSLACSPDGRLLASGSGYAPDEIRFWDPTTGKPIGPSLSGHRSWISALQFSADGHRLYSGSGDQTIGIWDVAARRLISKVRGHLDEVYAFGLDRAETNLLSGSMDGSLARCELDRVRPSLLRSDLPGQSWSPVYLGEGSTIAVRDEQGAVALWRSANPQLRSAIAALGTNNHSLATACARGLLACDQQSGPIQVWSLLSASLVTNLTEHVGPVNRLWFSNKGDVLVAGNGLGQFTIWDAMTWTKRLSVTQTNGVRTAAVSPDGRLVVFALRDGPIRWCDLTRGQPLGDTVAHRQPINDLAFSHDGTTLASVSVDGTAALWDTRSRQRKAHLPKAGFTGLQSVTFSPDGTRLAVGLIQGIRLYDLKTLRELITLSAPGDGFSCVAFSPGTDALLSGTGGGRSYSWRPPSFAELDAVLSAEDRLHR